jgi:hypothetical protein
MKNKDAFFMASPVSSQASSYNPILQPFQQSEGVLTPSDSVREYKLGSATIHDKIGGGHITINHWTEEGEDFFQPFVDNCALRNPFGPSIRRTINAVAEEFCFVNSQDITFEMDGPDYIKITEIDGNTTNIRYVDLHDKKKLDESEAYGYTAYPHKPKSITETEVRSQIAKIPGIWRPFSPTGIRDDVVYVRALYNSHGIAVHIVAEENEDYLITTYCAAPGDESLACVPDDHYVCHPDFDSSGSRCTHIWKDAHKKLMSCEGDLTTAQLNGDSAYYLLWDKND